MLELATLGLLQEKPLNGYRLKQRLELFMSGCISVNYGAIYPLLRRLEEKGFIEILLEKEGASGTNCKIYSITSLGKARLRQKMMEHPQESWVHSRSRFMIKFFFFSYLEPQERLKLLEHRLLRCQLRLENEQVNPFPVDPYQVVAWERYKNTIYDEIQWLEKQIGIFHSSRLDVISVEI